MISFLLTVHIWAEPSVIYNIDGKSNGFSWMMSPYISCHDSLGTWIDYLVVFIFQRMSFVLLPASLPSAIGTCMNIPLLMLNWKWLIPGKWSTLLMNAIKSDIKINSPMNNWCLGNNLLGYENIDWQYTTLTLKLYTIYMIYVRVSMHRKLLKRSTTAS